MADEIGALNARTSVKVTGLTLARLLEIGV